MKNRCDEAVFLSLLHVNVFIHSFMCFVRLEGVSE